MNKHTEPAGNRDLCEGVLETDARIDGLHRLLIDAIRRTEALEKKTAANARAQGETGRTLSRVAARINNIDPHGIEKELNGLRTGVDDLHHQYKIIVLQWATATEVERIIRLAFPSMLGVLSSVIIRSFDQPDSWWWEKRQLPLSSWVEVFRKLADDMQGDGK